ncbi:dipeptide ABC transporter ATP-binding protein [Nocardia camponoti]|uniref:ABC transporter ATP-binding protein n=1 Tax=Nocardia camponoti TaxID=1616106 RepID=A0A917QDM8_9NOCA|nr:ABC transporter ATP-binding protein [Nocardia camponoti]GGK45431.1 ABC transporter ATP-binding protein [Nocardia camponoti]
MSDVVLDVRDLVVRFGDQVVVDRVNVTVARGEVVALVGESGSGKSLTARSVLGLLPETARAEGSVRLSGVEVIDADASTLRELRGTGAAMVFQEPQTALNPVQKIGTQLAAALRAHGIRDKEAIRRRSVELLAAVEIPEPEARLHWYPHQLSGGQKQRVVIALALSGDPQLLIADEPTTALDVTVQAEILTLLRSLQRDRGTAILFITHNLGVVAEIADRVVVLRAGEVVEEREVYGLFAHPQAEYTQSLLASVPRLPEVGERADAASESDERPLRSVTVRQPAVVAEKGGAAGEVDAEDVLRIDDLKVVYRGRNGVAPFPALQGVSLSLAPREVLGLVGESGSGKSTLGRTALGLVPATSGTVLLQGVSLAGLSARELRALRKNVALVHQDVSASLDPRRSVADSIAEPLHVHKAATGALARAKVEALLESVRLPRDYADRRPGELSGGQRQRVALARALALAPRLLVADEPTSALDVSVQAQVLELFADLRAEYGFASLFISHDLAVVHQVADRVVVLRQGQIVESGAVGAVFGAPAQEYTRRLLDAVPVPDPAAARRDGRERGESSASGARLARA